jgi:hypothetical protein
MGKIKKHWMKSQVTGRAEVAYKIYRTHIMQFSVTSITHITCLTRERL